MACENPIYLYDIARYRISAEVHHLTENIDYSYSSAFRRQDSMMRNLRAVANEKNLPPRFFKNLDKITEDSYDDKGIKHLYSSVYLPNGEKDDYVITLYRLYPNRDVERDVYSYTLGRFLKGVVHSDDTTFYDVCTFEHGPLYDRFDTMKPELNALCSGALNPRIVMPSAAQEVAALAPSVLNIGRWEETIMDKEESDRNGKFDLMLKVFRVNIEG